MFRNPPDYSINCEWFSWCVAFAAAGNGPVCVGEEDEYAWLAETEPSDLYMNSGVYAGPPIKP